MIRRTHIGILAVLAALVAAPSALCAQGVSGPPNALQGFSQNRDQPVKIDAQSLEVRDKDKLATFSGSVQVVQGDTTLRCKTLAVFYDQENKGNAMPAAKPGPGGQQRIRRLEARGNVVVTQKDQTATGDLGIFDMASNTVTLNGNVVVTQGQSVLRGERLVVNLTTGVSHVEGGKTGGGRVQGMFMPSSSPEGAAPQGNAGAPQRTNSVRESAREGAGQAPRNAPRPSGLY
ncbi:MAG TPA: LptA/OstA family protein [Xanthobacteraceae bacterium]|nr:LptA/OstA family protein [Xanthobacteraceae bacterium]